MTLRFLFPPLLALLVLALPASASLRIEPSSLSPALHAGAEDDSLKAINEIVLAHKQLRARLDSLQRALDAMRSQVQSSQNTELQTRMRELEQAVQDTRMETQSIGQRIKDEMMFNPGAANVVSDSGITRLNGDVEIATGQTIVGNVVVSNGTVTVRGTIQGDLLVIDGAIRLMNASRVEGDVTAINARIEREDDAEIGGALREENGQDEWMVDDAWDLEDSDEDEDGMSMFKSKFFDVFMGDTPRLFPLGTDMGETVLRYNRHEGLYFGLASSKRLHWNSKPWIVGTGSLGYGFASHRWRYSLGLYFPIYLKNQIIDFGAEGHSFTDTRDQWVINRDENTAMSFFAKEDFRDYFEREGFSASASWNLRLEDALSVRASAAYVHDTYRSLAKETNWSLFGGDKIVRANPPILNGNLNSVVFQVEGATTGSYKEDVPGWKGALSIETAGGGLKGDMDFRQIMMDVRRYQPLLGFLNLNVRGRAVASSGFVPMQRAVELGGIGTLPGYGFKEFGGTHALLLNAELIVRSDEVAGHAEGWASHLLDMVNVIFFYDGGAVNTGLLLPGNQRSRTGTALDFGTSFSDGFDHMSTWKSDLGVALGNSDGSFRIGAAWRLDGIEDHSPVFVLRLSRPF